MLGSIDDVRMIKKSFIVILWLITARNEEVTEELIFVFAREIMYLEANGET